MLLQDKTALIFGGASGIGRAYVEALVKEGCKVYFVDINENAGEAFLEDLVKSKESSRVGFQRCDVSSENDIIDVFEKCKAKFEKLDVVVNTCGYIDEFNWEKAVDINLKSNIHIINRALKMMGKNNGGSGGAFVATASCSGFLPEFWGPVYSATKHASIALVRSWALPQNFQQHGVRMNCICPFRVKTDFLAGVRSDRMYHADLHLKDMEDHPEMLLPKDVADGLLLILKDDSINGRALRVSLENGLDFEPYEDIVHPAR